MSGCVRSERTLGRFGYRSSYYNQFLTKRVRWIELRVPQDRNGHFSTGLFERYEQSEKPFVPTLMQTQVHGVSTRKIAKAGEKLCCHGFSVSTADRINAKPEVELKKFAERALADSSPYFLTSTV